MIDSKNKEKISSEAYNLALTYANKNDSDVVLFNGEIDSDDVEALIKECREKTDKRSDVLLVLVTPGGDADAAYRLARCLQELYGKFTVFVPGWCKSAGTLVVIGAHYIVMGDYGELGPLDVQLSKSDELFEWNSGLVIDSALDALEARAIVMFERTFLRIKAGTRNRVTFKTATQIASSMVVELLSPIYSQIDPIKIGENAREMSVAGDYGKRLNEHSANLASRKSLQILVESYSSHGFVIDRKEAGTLFINVEEPADELALLETCLGPIALTPERRACFGYLSNDIQEVSDGEKYEKPTASNEGSTDAEVIRGNFGGAAGESGPSPEGHPDRVGQTEAS